MSEQPWTASGRALLQALKSRWRTHILAIEAEAGATAAVPEAPYDTEKGPTTQQVADSRFLERERTAAVPLDVERLAPILSNLFDPENAGGVHGTWLPEEDATDFWLKDDDGCSLIVSAADAAALINHFLAIEAEATAAVPLDADGRPLPLCPFVEGNPDNHQHCRLVWLHDGDHTFASADEEGGTP